MKMEEFAEEVLKEVTEKAGDRLSVQTVSANKNNGITLTGITASKHEGKGGACIYLNSYYKGYCDGRITLDWVTEDVYRKLMEHSGDLDGVDMRVLWDWEAAKGRIHAKLINRKMNQELLKRVPYREFLDLAVIYYVTVGGLSEGVNGAFTVSKKNMEVWRKDENALYQMAVSNMRLDGKPVFEDMEKIIRSIMPEEIPDLAVGIPKFRSYVLTNPEKVFGAVELLDGSTLKGIGDELGGDFIVLPSSLHESIIIPADGSVSYQELADIVTDINRNMVSIMERLSDHVYLYEREKGVLKIAA